MLAVAAPVTTEPRVDRHRRAADVGGAGDGAQLERQLVAAIVLALLGTMVLRLPLGAVLHPAHLRAHPRHALDCRRQARHARRDQRPGRDPRARRRLQLDGRPPGRAAGRHPQAGTPGDVRPHRRRPRPRPLAPDHEHRQRLQADRQDVGRRRLPRDVPPHVRARAAAGQARARRPAEHRQADPARALPGRIEPLGRRDDRVDAGAGRDRRRSRCSRSCRARSSTSRGTCSRSAASTATWW